MEGGIAVMARRYHEIKGLAEFTAKMIVSSEEDWKRFLHTVGHMYKYPFNPDVFACHAIISEGKYVDIILIGIFGGKRCR